jgi:photosynthetic reaction center cytochrome c subunit
MSKSFDKSSPFVRTSPWLLLAAAALLLVGCERPPMDTVQIGYRGVAMEQVTNPRLAEAEAAKHVSPAALPAVPAEGPRASEVFKNVQVLGNQSVGEFTRTMTAITAWVAPEQGCAYCHAAGEDLSADTLYTKVVARKMLQMTQSINADWKAHVAETGVTCWTCHRGQPVPAAVWFAPEAQAARMTGDKRGQNTPAATAAMASLPSDPFSPYLDRDTVIRVTGAKALPGVPGATIAATESTWSLMMHMSKSLGVNCTYCHNSRAFNDWSQSTPQRMTAWHGIRMARQLNVDHMKPLTDTFPAGRKGPTGDVAKVSCGTCHQGANKPLNGASLLKAHPELAGTMVAAAPAAAEAPPPAAASAPTQ